MSIKMKIIKNLQVPTGNILIVEGEKNIATADGYEKYYPYKNVEERLKSVGFDVLVFIPSYEEDLGRIACGNAILSGSLPEVEYSEV